MSIITLISDWKKNDYYLGAIKGKLLSHLPDSQIIDISHEVPSYNIAVGAFLLKHCFQQYPKNTVHIVCIKTDVSPENPCLIAEYKEHLFIGSDNGFFSLLKEDDEIKVYRVKNTWIYESTFPELDIFSEIAIALVKNSDINELAEETTEFNENIPYRPAIDNETITGSIIYIDSYQNAVANISRDLFERIGNKRPFEIFIQSHHYKVTKINKRYSETSPGELLALFNNADLLEIAIQNGNAKDLLNLKIGSVIRVKFKS